MNLSFLNLMLEKCAFPADAADFMRESANDIISKGLEEEFDSIVVEYVANIKTEPTDHALIEFTSKIGGSHYSYWLLLILLAAESAKVLYDKRGVSDEVFFDTFSDLRYKAIECMEEHGLWGTFVAGWYRLFISCRIIKFGRFEYEDCEFEMMNPYEQGDIRITNGTPIKSIHIPSSGEPMDPESRLASYKMAYDFYTKETGLDYLYCNCGSWLLYPGYREVFPEGTNCRDFMEDFDIIRSRDDEDFHDAWRVFGKHHRLPLEEYPEDTRMRRAFKTHMLNGGKLGSGTGILVYDGEKLLTRDVKTL